MRILYALLPCLFLSALLQAQNSPCTSCPAAPSILSQQRHYLCLSEKELIAHIATQKPIGPPGLNEPHMNSHGTIVACLCFSRKGKVTDIHILSGPAMMLQSFLDSVKDWTFRSVISRGRRYGGCGTLRIHVDMVDSIMNSAIEECTHM
jgi:hypothetical protein